MRNVMTVHEEAIRYSLCYLGFIATSDAVEKQEAKAKNSSWCIAKTSASDVALNDNIEYACNVLGDCKMIQPGGSCFQPNNLFNHASVVMNQYYALNGRNTWNCYFSGSGLIVANDPSYGSCKYA
ncbi:Glucan endo-1,3-beta-glucosidase [Spatholobus suberectus]|nr:Glucan endo-1,3-beta-glucosidase [Spatholobus suberectus]